MSTSESRHCDTVKMEPRLLRDLGYSLRRHFVDRFHIRHVQDLAKGSLVLDLGGNRIAKRGIFDIDRYGLQVVYANLSSVKRPHVQTDAAFLPFSDGRFDAVICSELLEHVPDAVAVAAEIHRVLKPDGRVLICVPFMNKIHGDPHDYARYTDFYWREKLTAIGFRDIEIERQGSFWCVLVDMMRDLAYETLSQERMGTGWLLGPTAFALGMARSRALAWDHAPDSHLTSSRKGFTTGFGIKAVKT